MLITRHEIRRRFQENLSWATAVDIATAWATRHRALTELCDPGRAIGIRAVCGLWGNITEPEALWRLTAAGELRIASQARLFHPKVYVFRGRKRSVAWVGSANFTYGGFECNEETLFETGDTAAMEEWFEDLWEESSPAGEGDIEHYARERRKNPPAVQQREDPLERHELPLDVAWADYWRALQESDHWWKHQGTSRLSVLAQDWSWRGVIAKLRALVQEDWSALTRSDQQRLLGLIQDEDEDWALLGRMRPPSLQAVFGSDTNRAAVEAAVKTVLRAKDADFPEVAISAYQKIQKVRLVGPAVASRLLTLARPDRLLSLNGASEEGLARYAGLASSTLRERPENYEKLLRFVYARPWFQTSATGLRSDLEKEIWSMRVALLDSFVYRAEPEAEDSESEGRP